MIILQRYTRRGKDTWLTEGERVGIVANPSDPYYMCDKAVEVFGPRAFGFDFDYVPYHKG